MPTYVSQNYSVLSGFLYMNISTKPKGNVIAVLESLVGKLHNVQFKLTVLSKLRGSFYLLEMVVQLALAGSFLDADVAWMLRICLVSRLIL
jgi:hypothetical protein